MADDTPGSATGEPATRVPLGGHRVELGLQLVPCRRDGILRGEEGDGAFKLAAVVAQLVGRQRPEGWSRALVAGFPFANFLEAPALLRGCGAVPAGSAAFEASGDPGAVLLRVVVVVLELGGNAGDVEAQAADS